MATDLTFHTLLRNGMLAVKLEGICLQSLIFSQEKPGVRDLMYLSVSYTYPTPSQYGHSFFSLKTLEEASHDLKVIAFVFSSFPS